MKALVLAGGRGARLESATDELNKCMLLYKEKPLIQYSLENAVAAGVVEIVIVVGYRAEQVVNHFGTTFHGLPIRYVIQWERKGLVHAIACAEHAMGGSDFLLFLADEVLINPAHVAMLRLFEQKGLFGVCGVVTAADRNQIRKTYAVLGDEATGRVYRLIEKPRVPLNSLMGTGNCALRTQIYDYIDRTPINVERHEQELPDLIQCAIDEGHRIFYTHIGDSYANVNTAEDLVLFREAAI